LLKKCLEIESALRLPYFKEPKQKHIEYVYAAMAYFKKSLVRFLVRDKFHALALNNE
jgi:hypothetical protein